MTTFHPLLVRSNKLPNTCVSLVVCTVRGSFSALSTGMYLLLFGSECDTTSKQTHSPGFSESTRDIGGAGTPLICLSGCRSMAGRTESRQFDPPARRARGTTCLLNVPKPPCWVVSRGCQVIPVRLASCERWEGVRVILYGQADLLYACAAYSPTAQLSSIGIACYSIDYTADWLYLLLYS